MFIYISGRRARRAWKWQSVHRSSTCRSISPSPSRAALFFASGICRQECLSRSSYSSSRCALCHPGSASLSSFFQGLATASCFTLRWKTEKLTDVDDRHNTWPSCRCCIANIVRYLYMIRYVNRRNSLTLGRCSSAYIYIAPAKSPTDLLLLLFELSSSIVDKCFL